MNSSEFDLGKVVTAVISCVIAVAITFWIYSAVSSYKELNHRRLVTANQLCVDVDSGAYANYNIIAKNYICYSASGTPGKHRDTENIDYHLNKGKL